MYVNVMKTIQAELFNLHGQMAAFLLHQLKVASAFKAEIPVLKRERSVGNFLLLQTAGMTLFWLFQFCASMINSNASLITLYLLP